MSTNPRIDVSKLEVRDNPEAQRFEIRLSDEDVAKIDYRIEDNVIIFVHTEVPEGYEGMGIADKMAHAALEASKSAGKQVLPLCPFVSAYIRRHPEYKPITIEYP